MGGGPGSRYRVRHGGGPPGRGAPTAAELDDVIPEDEVRADDEELRRRGLPMFVPVRRWHEGLIGRLAPPMVFVTTLVLWSLQAVRLFDGADLTRSGDASARSGGGMARDTSEGLIVLLIAIALALVAWFVLLLRSDRRPRRADLRPRRIHWRWIAAAVVVYAIALGWASFALSGAETDADAARIVTVLLVVLVVSVPVALTLACRYVLTRLSGGFRTSFALIVMLGAYTGLAAELRENEHLTQGHFFIWSTLVVLAVVLGVWSGLFAILAWAGRAALRELETLASIATRVIPVFMMIVVFGLLSAEAWQITAGLRGTRLVQTVGLIMAIALFTTLGTARSELVHERRRGDGQARGGDGPLVRLNRAQTINTYVKIAATQLIQGLLFLAAVSAVLLVLASVAIPDATVQSWIEARPEPLRFLGIDTGFSRNAFDTSVFMAAFAMLSFLVASATDPAYRDELFDPMIDDIRTTIDAVDADGTLRPSPA